MRRQGTQSKPGRGITVFLVAILAPSGWTNVFAKRTRVRFYNPMNYLFLGGVRLLR